MPELIAVIAWVIVVGVVFSVFIFFSYEHRKYKHIADNPDDYQPEKGAKVCHPPDDFGTIDRIHTDQLNRIEQALKRIENPGTHSASKTETWQTPGNTIDLPCKKCGEPFSFTLDVIGSGGPEK